MIRFLARAGGTPEVLQEVLADLKMGAHKYLYVFFQEFPFNKKDFKGKVLAIYKVME